jgi:hypothetical protein
VKQEEPADWTVLEYRAVVGHGRKCYERVSSSMREWRIMDTVCLMCVHLHASTVSGSGFCPNRRPTLTHTRVTGGFGCPQVGWAGIHNQAKSGMLATFAKLSIGFGWAINPCRFEGTVLPSCALLPPAIASCPLRLRC